MRRIAVAVYSLLISGISKLTGLSDARVSVKFMIALLAVLLPCSVLVFTTNLRATSNIITVNNTTDPASTSGNGFCTLREAINNANAASDTSGGDCAPGTGTDTIKFSVSGTITLGTNGTLPPIANSSPGSLTIDGSGQSVTVNGADSFQVLQVNTGATLSLNSLTIAHGKPAAGILDGGAIYDIGTLAITNSTLSDNSAPSGGHGGAIYSASGSVGPTLTISNSTFSGNTSPEDGGAIYNHGVPLTITGSTFSNNSGYGGGGVYSDATSGTISVSNSTFSGNSASLGSGGGILTNSSLTLTNSTFSGNSAPVGGGGAIWTAAATVTNSILANSSGGGNCAGSLTPPVSDGGYNISDDGSCGFTGTGANGKTIGDSVSDSNLALDPGGLANNGGPTETIKLELGSYAIDAVPLAHQCPPTDQRGDQRPEPGDNSGACDIGAVESTLEGAEKLVVNPSPPSKLNFGTVSVGTTSASQTATITSEFNDDTVDFFATFILANYIKTGSTCGSTLGPLQSCQVSFACKPKTTGPLIGAYAFLYGSVETAGLRDGDDYLKIGVAQFTCTGG